MIVIFGRNLRIIILLSSITLIIANKVDPPPKSVNVALETSFLFDPKELHQNKHFVSNVRRFLGKLLKAMDPQDARSRFRAHGKRRDTKRELEERTDSTERLGNKTEAGTSIKNVFEFVKNIGQNFVNLTGNKIAEAVSNMHVELITEPSKYKGFTAISEETKQDKHGIQDFKTIITDSFKNWMRRYPEEISTIINNTVNSTNPLLNTFARKMNNYYNADDIRKLKKLLKKFKRHIENHQDTSVIVNDLLNHVVFKKYGSLNDSTKSALIEDLKMCSEILLTNDVYKSFRRSLPNPKIETDEMRNIDDLTYKNLRSIDNKLRDTREKNKDNQKEESNTNEIVVDSAEFHASTARKPTIFD